MAKKYSFRGVKDELSRPLRVCPKENCASLVLPPHYGGDLYCVTHGEIYFARVPLPDTNFGVLEYKILYYLYCTLLSESDIRAIALSVFGPNVPTRTSRIRRAVLQLQRKGFVRVEGSIVALLESAFSLEWRKVGADLRAKRG